MVWVLERGGIVSGKICEIVWGEKTFCFPAERVSEWVTSYQYYLWYWFGFHNRFYAPIYKDSSSNNWNNRNIIKHLHSHNYQSLVHDRSFKVICSDKANFNPLNHFGFHLQGRPLAVGAFSSATQKKFIILDKMQFSELLSMVGFYRAHSFLPGCRHQLSLQGGAVQWSGLLCPSVGLAISYIAGRPLQQKGGPCTKYILKKYNYCRASFFLPIYQKQASKWLYKLSEMLILITHDSFITMN